MAACIVCIRETSPGERRVALTPETAKKFAGLGARVLLERGAGAAACFPDAAYAGVEFTDDADAALAQADVLVCVQPPANEKLSKLRPGTLVVGLLAPHADPARVQAFVDGRLTAFPLEKLPRTTRAQAMDVLSSQAGMAGYKAVLLAAQLAPRRSNRSAASSSTSASAPRARAATRANSTPRSAPSSSAGWASTCAPSTWW
jgi:NAD(P) transhydrogenase subunit alpha